MVGFRKTILVVEDYASILEIVATILRKANFSVLVARCGPDAIKVAKETHGQIDLLLSDMYMPEMSGDELAHILTKTRPEMHVMLMSADEDEKRLGFDHGWPFIEKPFAVQKLVEMVNDVLYSPAQV